MAGKQCQLESGERLSPNNQSYWGLFWLKHGGGPFKCCDMFQVPLRHVSNSTWHQIVTHYPCLPRHCTGLAQARCPAPLRRQQQREAAAVEADRQQQPTKIINQSSIQI